MYLQRSSQDVGSRVLATLSCASENRYTTGAELALRVIAVIINFNPFISFDERSNACATEIEAANIIITQIQKTIKDKKAEAQIP